MNRPAEPPRSETPASQPHPETIYEMVGGHEAFVRLTALFYEGVAADAPLRDLYPEEDLGPAEDRLRMFLEQFFGGPKTYSETRGHPRLRMRHVDFAVTPAQRDRWLHHMGRAMDQMDFPAEADQMMRAYFERAAHFMVNTLQDDAPPLSESAPPPPIHPAPRRPRLSVRRVEE
ncbi:globin [Kytococcus sedentarius]|uniref:globin n=1 Tax=Kytococcus sedentarius TaxID=1276 RepID=UPI0035BBB8FC